MQGREHHRAVGVDAQAVAAAALLAPLHGVAVQEPLVIEEARARALEDLVLRTARERRSRDGELERRRDTGSTVTVWRRVTMHFSTVRQLRRPVRDVLRPDDFAKAVEEHVLAVVGLGMRNKQNIHVVTSFE